MNFKILINTLLFSSTILFACSKEVDPLSAFETGNYKMSFNIWNPMAENGDDTAQNHIAIHYHLGLGVEKDINKSLYWYKSAAEKGNPDAQKNLGVLYISGELGNPDFEKAYIWLFAAYQQGNKNAYKSLNLISGQLSPNRIPLLKQRSKQYIVNDKVDPENDDF